MEHPISEEAARPIINRLLKQQVTDFRVYQKVHGYFISFRFDGETILYRIVKKENTVPAGSWSRTAPEVHIPVDSLRISEMKSMAFHHAMIKLLWEKYHIDWRKGGKEVAEAIELKIAKEVGITWPAWKLGLEKHTEEMAGPA